MKKILPLVGIVGLIAATVIAVLVFSGRVPQVLTNSGGDRGKCLNEGQQAVYTVEESSDGEDHATVVVFDAGTHSTTTSRDIPISSASHYHPVETRPCKIYALVGRGFNEGSSRLPDDFYQSIYSFSYNGQDQKEVLRLTRANAQTRGGFDVLFDFDFRVSPDEQYIALIRGYMGKADFAVVVKPLADTSRDSFALSFNDVAAKYQNVIESNMSLLDWSPDGRYLWLELSEQAYMNGWVRIDSRDWSYEVFEAPDTVLGGYPLNVETGWVPLIPGANWSGFAEDHERIDAERAEAGEQAALYLYNVLTGERRLVSRSDASSWRNLHGKWLDNSTLQYDMPDGTTRTYTVQ